MTNHLTPQNATVTTATIQVQALTIGKKQVTLAVFRQLKEEALIADDGALKGPAGESSTTTRTSAATLLSTCVSSGRTAANCVALQCRCPTPATTHIPWRTCTSQPESSKERSMPPWSDPEGGDTLRLGGKTAGGWSFYTAGRFAVGNMLYRGEVSAGLRENWRGGRSVDAQHAEAFRSALAHVGLMPQAARGEIAPHLLDLLPARQYQDTVDELVDLPQLFIAV